MRQQSFKHRGEKCGSIGGGVLVVLAVIIGAFLVYQLILWFRSSNEENIEKVVDSALVTSQGSVSSTVPLNSTAILKTSDLVTVGTVVRSGTSDAPSYSLIANISALSPDSSYEVWLVKDGLADVKTAGILSFRADGSLTTTFTTTDPLNYPTIIITLEPNDDNPEPSGNRIAEGRFE